jgi:hypothetical protein
VSAPAWAEGFTNPYNIGNAFGPGKTTRDCLVCGAVVRDDAEMLILHRNDHEKRS